MRQQADELQRLAMMEREKLDIEQELTKHRLLQDRLSKVCWTSPNNPCDVVFKTHRDAMALIVFTGLYIFLMCTADSLIVSFTAYSFSQYVLLFIWCVGYARVNVTVVLLARCKR